MGKQTRIAMWSGPRNISTAMMRSFGARADAIVVDEPFYAAYLDRTGLEHPMRAEIITVDASRPTSRLLWTSVTTFARRRTSRTRREASP